MLHVSPALQFAVGIAALLPIAWLIARATEQAGKHAGPVGGALLNATFGNAPELFFAFFAIAEGLLEVVRASLSGSVPSNLLLMLGLTLVLGRGGELDRRSVFSSLGVLAVAAAAFGVVALGHALDDRGGPLPAWEVPAVLLLLVVYLAVTAVSIRRALRGEHEDEGTPRWSLRRTLIVLAGTTVAAGVVAEAVADSIIGFSETTGISLFFVSAVFIALVTDTAEHGAAVYVSYRGHLKLGTEVVLRTISQIVALLLPIIVLGSWLIEPMPLDFRPVELIVVAGSLALAAAVLARGRATRVRGGILVGGYAVAVAAFFIFG